jgi:hypothetical protein
MSADITSEAVAAVEEMQAAVQGRGSAADSFVSMLHQIGGEYGKLREENAALAEKAAQSNRQVVLLRAEVAEKDRRIAELVAARNSDLKIMEGLVKAVRIGIKAINDEDNRIQSLVTGLLEKPSYTAQATVAAHPVLTAVRDRGVANRMSEATAAIESAVRTEKPKLQEIIAPVQHEDAAETHADRATLARRRVETERLDPAEVEANPIPPAGAAPEGPLSNLTLDRLVSVLRAEVTQRGGKAA